MPLITLGTTSNHGCLEKWELGNGSGEWGVSNEEEVTGVSISSLLKVFN